ncbi:MAG TPA: DUF1552 domain-containing protein [Polyangia bacterium]
MDTSSRPRLSAAEANSARFLQRACVCRSVRRARAVGILSGAPLMEKARGGAPFNSTFTAKSVDQVAADLIVTQNPKFKAMKSLELGISTKVNRREGTTLQYLSHNGPDSANPPEYSPAAVYTRLFGGFMPPTTGGMPMVDITRGLRRSVLDAVKNDFKNLLTRVSAFDKERLDQHAENIRAIEGRLSMDTFLPASCMVPTKPTDPAAGVQDESLEEKTKLMGDLLAVAFGCDITRVFSMLYSGSTATTVGPSGRSCSRYRRLPDRLGGHRRRLLQEARHPLPEREREREHRAFQRAPGDRLQRAVVRRCRRSGHGQLHRHQPPSKLPRPLGPANWSISRRTFD